MILSLFALRPLLHPWLLDISYTELHTVLSTLSLLRYHYQILNLLLRG
jgi:hypothetical protein